MANNRQLYKRSEMASNVLTEDEKKNVRALEVTSNIIKWALIAVVLLSLIFSMLSLVKVEVNDPQLDTVAHGMDKYANLSAFDLFSGWFAEATFNNADRGINIGYQYKHVFDYIVGRVPALKQAASSALGAGAIFGAITPEQDSLLDMAYIAMLITEIVTMIWLVGMALVFVLSFVKSMRPTRVIVNAFSIVHVVLSFVMFAFTLALASNSTSQFVFSVGIGMWLNMLVSVILLSFVIANIICNAKVKANRL